MEYLPTAEYYARFLPVQNVSKLRRITCFRCQTRMYALSEGYVGFRMPEDGRPVDAHFSCASCAYGDD